MNRGLEIDLDMGLAMEEALHTITQQTMRVALTWLPSNVHRLP